MQQGGKIANIYLELLDALTPKKANLLTNQQRLQIQDLIAILVKLCFISYHIHLALLDLDEGEIEVRFSGSKDGD